MLIHEVQPGQSLWSIARYYGVGFDQILAANQFPDPARLVPGQAVLVPSPYRTHTVQPGESLWSIAQRYGTTVEQLVQLNALSNPNQIMPGMVLITPRGVKPTIDVNAFIFPEEEGAEEINEVGNLLTYLTPFAYEVREDGSLSPLQDEEEIRAAYGNRIVPMMCIVNFTPQEAGSERISRVLNDSARQNRLLDSIMTTMRTKGYLGLNVDFEFVRPEDREQYNQFLRRVRDRLHGEGYFLSTSLAPKTRGDQPGLLYEAHDYPAHGEIADFVILMTYEWGYRLGPPRAISPIDEIRRVLDYAVSVIPREKIMMGFQVYARDWLLPHVQGQEAETFSIQEALRRAGQYGAVIQYDERAQSPFYRYVDRQGRLHEVWFEDARSAQAKFDLVTAYGLKGISYWVLGYPFPQNWVLLGETFQIRKRVS